jgi:hypothetical protein
MRVLYYYIKLAVVPSVAWDFLFDKHINLIIINSKSLLQTCKKKQKKTPNLLLFFLSLAFA